MDNSRIGARTAIGPVLEAAIAALLDEQKAEHNLVERVGRICDSAGASEPAATGRFVRPPEELAEYEDWLQAQQKELRGRPLSASTAECPGDERDQPGELVIVEPEDWRTKVDEAVDSLRRHGFDGAADEIVRHLPPQPKLKREERACEKHDMELAFSRKEGADKRKAVAWQLEYLGTVRDELAGEEHAAKPDSPSGFLGGEDLADALGVHSSRRGAFLQQLRRRRKSLGDDCWQEVSEPRPNNPRFLYRADSQAVRDVAAKYKSPKSA